MKFYKTGGRRWGVEPNIYTIEAERATDKSIWINGRRLLKSTEFEVLHSTWQEAYDFLLSVATRKRDNARGNLDRAENVLKLVKEMRKP